MTRRALLAAPAAAAILRGSQSRRDRFGGWPGLRFEPSGYFRLERRDRWWLVTPDGAAFLSLGLNHTEPGLLRQDYNRAHWLKAFGVLDPEDPRFLDGFRRRVEEDLRVFGFNTLGCHSPARRFWRPCPVPYVETFKCVHTDHWLTPRDEDFSDVFADSFAAHCERRASEAGLDQLRNDPLLIGYAFTDCPILTEHDAAPRQTVVYGAPRAGVSTWPRVLRNLPAGAPGKRAYVELIRTRYGADIRSFNQAYGVTFGSFDALADAVRWRPASDPRNPDEARDNDAFLELILDRYYGAVTAAVRRHDPNHLIFGDKLNGNTDTPGFTVAAAARYTDLVFFQWYGYYGEQKTRLDEWSRLTGKPLFNGDGSYSVPGGEMPRPLGPHSPTQEDRAERTIDYARRAFGRSDFVGWSYCGWLDSWRTMPGKELRQHAGLQDPFGRRYGPMVRALQDFSGEMYDLARGGVPASPASARPSVQ